MVGECTAGGAVGQTAVLLEKSPLLCGCCIPAAVLTDQFRTVANQGNPTV